MKNQRKNSLITWLLIGLLSCAGLAITVTGCANQQQPDNQAVAYKSLRDIWIGVDAAMKVYGTAVVNGKVSKEKEQEIDALYYKVRNSWRLAVEVARNNQALPAPEEVVRLANQLQQLIASL
ncbi:MAG TPA: hypothetical protein PKJ00_03495 [Verrucomicrobiota bacterium]|nr:hypothetical protein [Verrucomicrobiota bacterium]HNS68989.1 hypothetical protein [Verrucomicrobiota bacterium]